MTATAEPVLPGGAANDVTPPTAALAEVVQSANLRYVSDTGPGLGRKRRGKGFSYLDTNGEVVKDKALRKRLEALAIPPAWTDVWISPVANSHIQATGRDERGRKQYRYHPQWREVRDSAKFEHMLAFGKQLPRIRRRVARDLKLPGLPKDKVLAAVVKLLETTLIRVGNATYAKENGSYGLTTIRKKHVDVSGAEVAFEFVGKSGKEWEVALRDPQIARIVKRCEELPGYELFKYIGDDGLRHDLGSEDVNDYLKRISGEDISAKDFRTWAGTVQATFTLTGLEGFETEAQATKNVVATIKEVAKKLGNTPAVCRKSYVHPDVITCYLDGSLTELAAVGEAVEASAAPRGLHLEEVAVLKFLEARHQLVADSDPERA